MKIADEEVQYLSSGNCDYKELLHSGDLLRLYIL